MLGSASHVLSAIVLLSLMGLAQESQPRTAVEYPSPLVREQLRVRVHGQDENWQLTWKAAPRPYCEPYDTSLTCPCEGFAYGEVGDLEIRRFRGRANTDSFQIASVFEKFPHRTDNGVKVARWPSKRDDYAIAANDKFAQLVAKRPVVQVMNLGDYDHDGEKAEFYLQTVSEPCGKSEGVVIGVPRGRLQLQAFGTIRNPDKPLYLLKTAWEALRNASQPVEVVEYPCGDHGRETESRVWLRWTAEGIDGTRREYSCPAEAGSSQRLLREQPL
jgi:hypothetical protein